MRIIRDAHQRRINDSSRISLHYDDEFFVTLAVKSNVSRFF